MPSGKRKAGVKNIADLVQLFESICESLGKYKDKVYTFSKDSARKIRLRLYGKQIAVIGPVAAGKTTFLHVLQNPTISIDPMSYEKTTDAVPFTDRLDVEWKLPLDESNQKSEVIRLKVRKPKDVGGEAAQRDTQTGWIDVCMKSHFLFYLFDASKYSEDELITRMREDFDWIANNAQAFAPGFKIIILANKFDRIVDERREAFMQELAEIEAAIRDALGPYSNHLVLATPCCLLSGKHRTTAISLAMEHLAELT